MQDLNDKLTGGTLSASEWNEVPSEIQNVIEGLGITLSGGDLNQLGKAIAGYVANGNFYTDSGAADSYVMTVIGIKQAPPSYADGMMVKFVAGNTNTGASTINVAGLGVKDLRLSGGAVIPAGKIVSGSIITASYVLSQDRFELSTSATETQEGLVELATDAETQTGTDAVRVVTPAGLSARTATESRSGVVELATQAETDAGADNTRAVTSLKLKKSPQTAGAWITFNGQGVVAVLANFNAPAIIDNGVGDYTITFTDAWADANYTYAGSGEDTDALGDVLIGRGVGRFKNTTNISLVTNTSAGIATDFPEVVIMFFGNK